METEKLVWMKIKFWWIIRICLEETFFINPKRRAGGGLFDAPLPLVFFPLHYHFWHYPREFFFYFYEIAILRIF